MEREEMLMLSGFDKITTKDWKVKPLLIPPVVSEHFTVGHILYMTYKFISYKQLNLSFISVISNRSVRELLMTSISHEVLVFLTFVY